MSSSATLKAACLVFVLIGLSIQGGRGQSPDSVLTIEELMKYVMRNHPTAVRASLPPAMAEAALRSARGSFDPKAYADWSRKSFDGKNYWRTGDFGLKSQTSIAGLQVKAGYQTASGQFLNPEGSLPTAGQAFLGVEVPLLQGLLIDQPRADLQKAQIGMEVSQNERRFLLNELAYQTILAYVDWAVAYDQREVARNALDLIAERLASTRESFFQGAMPGIDTLETYIQLQTQQILLQDAQLALEQASIGLSYFLWGTPPTGTLPVPFVPDDILATLPAIDWQNSVRLTIGQTHPELQMKIGKLEQLTIDERWAKEQLKPFLSAGYTLIGNGLDLAGFPEDGEQAFIDNLLTENYKWEIKASFPLFLRKERGKLEQVRVKMLDTERFIDEKQQQIVTKIENSYRQWELATQQIQQYEGVVANYQRLVEAERDKFRVGTSSVFLLNSRLQKLVEAQLKLVQLRGKQQKYYYSSWYAAGQLHDLLNLEDYVLN
jgi:outer membrane protein TolC